MPVVLCQHCWCWAELSGPACAECGFDVDLTHPDPPADDFAAVLGRTLAGFEPVLCRRNQVAHSGTLWLTENGLVFLPILQRTASSLLLPIPADVSRAGWTRLQFWKRAGSEPVGTRPAIETAELVEEFYRNPGGAFIARANAVQFSLSGRTLRLSRRIGGTISWDAGQDALQFEQLLRVAAADVEWLYTHFTPPG